MNQYHKLYTPEDSAVVFIDHQPQMLFGVASMDRASLINNVTLLAKCAKEFNVPAVLTAVETEGFSGYVWPMLLDVFPGQPVVERQQRRAEGEEVRGLVGCWRPKVHRPNVHCGATEAGHAQPEVEILARFMACTWPTSACSFRDRCCTWCRGRCRPWRSQPRRH